MTTYHTLEVAENHKLVRVLIPFLIQVFRPRQLEAGVLAYANAGLSRFVTLTSVVESRDAFEVSTTAMGAGIKGTVKRIRESLRHPGNRKRQLLKGV
ncbi:hypothetical protein BaRGS_00004180 [Batillaria attramentaria]|uniref:Uncharacterized protein n=1 Tax=Batillaria attramentaria TaxID=370345 RepID=A0ABD0LYC5_9CAEN